MNTENLKTLKIHKLSQAQYERELLAGNIDPTALYLTPDDGVDLSEYATLDQLEEKEAVIYRQTEAPEEAPDGALWIDTDEEGGSGGSGSGKCSVPEITAEVEGAFLCVVNGEATWQVIPDAEGVGF